eukprot:405857_1
MITESSPELPEMFPPNEWYPYSLRIYHHANLSPRTNLSPQGHVAIPNQMDDVAQRRPASTLSTLHIITSRISNVPVPPLPNSVRATRRKRRIRRESPNS